MEQKWQRGCWGCSSELECLTGILETLRYIHCKKRERQRVSLASSDSGPASSFGGWKWVLINRFALSAADVPGLHASSHIGHLQQEAHWALCEVLEPWYPAGQNRLARTLLMASTLKSIPPSLLEDLFFRPIIGDTDIAGLLEDMLLLR